ncbi:MAG: hypothetical protein ABI134_06815 [Byssovorax sp.]
MLLTAAIALASLGGCNDVGDAICPQGTNPDDTADGCPYGPPGGPRIHEDGCPDIPQISGAMCTVSWRSDIWPLLNEQAPEGQGCGVSGCHGSGAGGLTLPTDDAAKSFSTLKAYSPQVGYPYINDAAPGHTWILCNLHGDKGGRSLMPPTKMEQATYDKVKLWAQCGQKLDSASAGTGTGGGGGGGGGGGSP